MRPYQTRKPCVGVLLWAVAGIALSELFPCSLPFAALAVFCFTLSAFLGCRFLPFGLLVLAVFFIRHDLDWRQSPGRYPIDLLSQSIPVIQATGIVTSDPAAAGSANHIPCFRFEMRVTGVSFNGNSVKTRFPAEVYWTGPPPEWGDKIRLDSASISPVSPPRNPGEFNFSAYLAREGVFAQLSCGYGEDTRIIARGKGNPIVAWARNCRAFLQRRLTLDIDDDPDKAGLVETITLGLKEETSDAIRDLFQHVGALHLFVVNGLHIALLASILAFLVKPLRIYRRFFACIIIPILFAYALVTGLSPGSVRAAIMAAIMFGASFVERRPFSFNTLAATALILLLWDTNELFREGFEFSFGVVFTIILLADFIQRAILPAGVPDRFLPRSLWTSWQRVREASWRRVSGLVAISIAASLGSFPFSAGYFNVVTPSGFVANLLLVPIAFCILAEAIFSLFASIAGSLALLFNNVNWLLASVMLAIVHFFAYLPGGYFFVSTAPELKPPCRVTVLDLNPGQAIVIQSQGASWLVDCGNASAYFRVVRPYLQSCGINRLDGLILTRGATASIGAAAEVITDFSPRQVVESSVADRSAGRRFFDASLAKAAVPRTLVQSGNQLRLSPAVNCTVLFPPAGFAASTAADKSLVLSIQEGPFRVLLMSDSAFIGEHWLMDNSRDIHASIVVLGGQSADLAGTDEFFDAVRPFAAIRGAPGYIAPLGQDRRWAGRLLGRGITPFVQPDTGAVTIDLSQSQATICAFLNHQREIQRAFKQTE